MAFPYPRAVETWRRLAKGELPRETLRLRSRILDRIRAYFRARGFLEVDPPIAVPFPNIDPNVYPVTVSDAGGRASRRFLHTSPELSMKKLLAAGCGNIFYLGKVFRDREGSPLHHPEFTMLEWYRVGESADAVMQDVEGLARDLAREIHGREEIRRGNGAVSLAGPWTRWELSDAFGALLGAPMDEEAPLRAALAKKGLRPGASESWEDLFFRACVDVIEPALRDKGTVFLTGFPSALAAMAKRRAGREGTCERFEGYLCGVELVNGYEELTDPLEQETRLRQLADRHEHRTGIALPVDPGFLEALRMGLPPCSGAALGVDRMAMLLLGKETIEDVALR
ncbi:MAG: EF-P lysine aminoacylase GenX [Deltaproteobacteria bacterium]|nr:EF-P lysine aminoacylase GenX [Deltaproteobacteria bacterium]PWB61463.1 MAG: EF-P lysine aminoacylase GenX [Deltaproteobacteria bacterium]